MMLVSNPAARHWKTGARDALRALEAGLAAPDGKRKPVFWGFVSNTDTLVREAQNLGLDPRPFEAVAAVVYSWNHPYYADEPLDRERLREVFDAALAALPEIEEAIRRHEAKQWAELAPRPIVPVTMNGRHTGNGALSIEPAITSELPKVPPPPEPDSELIEDRELARRLRGKRAYMQARIVEFMAGKSEAGYEDLSEHLYPQQDTNDQRIRSLVGRLIHSAEEFKTASVYSQATARVYRDAQTQTRKNS